MAGLIVHDSIVVKSQGGDCRIQLCFGDITKLQKKDKVDVIFVSAFSGNYLPLVGTVIGALHDNLKLDVEKLSQDKEEDLRSLYSCWWSKPLPSSLPYKRLLCFESRRNRAGRPQELIGHAFRCLVPILKNRDASIITPLLSTGNQGYDPATMLAGMVHAAVNWVKAGLPIRLLKIVIYAKIEGGDATFLRKADKDSILHAFEDLKTQYESANFIPQEVALEYDVYLSYSEKDQKMAELIQIKLTEEKPDIRIFTSRQKVDTEVYWQEEMYNVMQKCARVITVLSPHYLASEDCMEQYNIALCCNRQAHRDMLAPLFVETVSLPTYMGLVQYADCREDTDASISKACNQLVGSLTSKVGKVVKVATTDPCHYDVFVSYCHADMDRATPIVNQLQKLSPKLRIFFDFQELKTGHAWQRTLYHSIDGTSCMIALISPHYLKSAVCMEEYTLAQTKHLSEDKLRLIPICLHDGLESDWSKVTHLPMFDARPDVFDAAVNSICAAIVSWFKTNSFRHLDKFLQKNSANRVDVAGLMEKLRSARFQAEYGESFQSSHFPPKLDKLMDDGSDKTVGATGGEGRDGDEEGQQKGGDATEKGHQEEVKDKMKEQEHDLKDAIEKKDTEKKDGEKVDEKEKDVEKDAEQIQGGAESGKTEVEKKVENQENAQEEVNLQQEIGSGVESSSATVVFSYHPSDKKFVTFFQFLLEKFAPNIVVKSDFTTDQERLDCLEKADNIVALLSPSYIESPQHVEEFHMGLWRQRISPAEAPLLLPIQIAVLPLRPTYFRLVGYPVNIWDSLWAELFGKRAVRSRPEVEEIRHKVSKAGSQKLSPDEILPMTQAAQILIASIKKQRVLKSKAAPSVRPALVNTAKLQAELDSLTGQSTAPLQEYLVAVPPEASKACSIM